MMTTKVIEPCPKCGKMITAKKTTYMARKGLTSYYAWHAHKCEPIK